MVGYDVNILLEFPREILTIYRINFTGIKIKCVQAYEIDGILLEIVEC